MRFVLRTLGTWLMALAFILLVIDGTRSLGANALVWTPLADTWTSLNAESLAAVRAFLASRFLGAMLEPGFEAVLAMPGFLVLAVPGIVLALAGRSRRTRVLIRQDQF